MNDRERELNRTWPNLPLTLQASPLSVADIAGDVVDQPVDAERDYAREAAEYVAYQRLLNARVGGEMVEETADYFGSPIALVLEELSLPIDGADGRIAMPSCSQLLELKESMLTRRNADR